jgi:ribosomal protein S27AE
VELFYRRVESRTWTTSTYVLRAFKMYKSGKFFGTLYHFSMGRLFRNLPHPVPEIPTIVGESVIARLPCPTCGDLTFTAESQDLFCAKCNIHYRIHSSLSLIFRRANRIFFRRFRHCPHFHPFTKITAGHLFYGCAHCYLTRSCGLLLLDV